MASNIDFARNISINECATLVRTVGDKATILIEGHMGSGKSTLIKMLKEALPDHVTAYFDMTNIDLGDLMLPAVQHQHRETEFYPNALFGMRHNKPGIYMFDEFGKASRPVQNACLPILLERRVGMQKLQPGSLVFATTNLGAEGVGDMLQPHARNRMVIVQMRKPTADEWIENFALNAGVAPEVIAWVRETPQVMDGFETVDKPDDNPYIFHPKRPQTAFVTPRSLEKASDVIKQRQFFSEDTLTHALRGTVGDRAALDLRSFVQLADKLPTWAEIMKDPVKTPVPDSPAAVFMLVFTAIGRIERDTVNSWLDYCARLPKEAQALFAHQVMKVSGKGTIVAVNPRFTKYCMENSYQF